MKTPGVYIDEKNSFPNSVPAVETAVPAFIGYTEKAEFNGKPLKNKPVRIETFKEFEMFFGKECRTKYNLRTITPEEQDFDLNKTSYTLEADSDTSFLFYNALKFFYQNGGSSCFIVSIGTYADTEEDKPFTTTKPFFNGINLLKKEVEPTMIVIPDAVLFTKDNCYSIQEYMLSHCGEEKNKIAILDIHEGYKELSNPNDNPISNFRNKISSFFFSYGTAYYPWLHTTVVQESEINYKNLNDEGLQTLVTICKAAISKVEKEKQKALNNYIDLLLNSQESTNKEKIPDVNTIHNILSVAIPEYKIVMQNILKKENLLPPSAAMAGIYSLVDNQRGVWKAPANVSINNVVSPAVLIDHNQQEDLNMPLNGKSICAIRSFTGLGTMVWGARTLDGNSLDWRYINIRRTLIMIEQSIKLAVQAYIFEPNDSSTWASIKLMIESFLTNLWKQGALAGTVPADAFNVSVGLGSTMTANDILEGKMNIEVKLAISRPAEFIVITFQQQQQNS